MLSPSHFDFSAIAAALAKQEAILAQLHEDLNAGNSDEVRVKKFLVSCNMIMLAQVWHCF